jgi:predicted Zn-dependent peptidase
MSAHHIFSLPNGLRVVHQQVPNTRVVHCGIFLDIGSRDETTVNQGIAHFWEHMAFKGTRKRTALQIISSLEAVGGELNAFTDKEKVVFYASVREQYLERAIDVLSDIAFHSVFPEAQIRKERGVILEEMAMYQDNAEDTLQDEFETLLYPRHPMGMKIIGRPETVQSFHRKDFLTFFTNHLDTSRIVFSCVGNVSSDTVLKLASRYLKVPRAARKVKRKKISVYQPGTAEVFRHVKQARCAMGREAYALDHPQRIPFYLLVNMLGGPALNSRLNLALREKYGFVYSVDAHYVAYTDTGMFAVFFGTEPRQLDRCIRLVHKEMDRFMHTRLSPRQLKAACEQLKGQLAMAEENNLSLMFMMGRAVLDTGKVPLLEEIYEHVEAITPQALQHMAGEMFNPDKLSCLTMLPVNK